MIRNFHTIRYISLEYDLGEGEIIYVGEHQVFYRKNDLSNTYLWNDGKYAMMIESDFPIEASELERIIDGAGQKK